MALDRGSVVKSADRVLDIFELLAQKARPMSHTEVALALGIPKSSLSQLLANLVSRRYLTLDQAKGSYELGEGLKRLVVQQNRTSSLPEMAQPLCDRITRMTGESSSLNMRREDRVERVCGSNSTQQLTYSMKMGELAPLYAVSSGKAILAKLDQDALNAYFSTVQFASITKHTITSVSKLRRDINEVRKSGVAWSFEEYTPGIIGVAVAVCHEEQPVGAFNIALPSVRDDPQHRREMVSALRDAASILEKELKAVSQIPSQ
jgi:DNA-binding IclR family transcriptional regulator